MATMKIKSTLSAQPSTARPNPFVQKALAYIDEHSGIKKRRLSCADQGCGKLRHFPLLSKRFARIVLVDTEEQLNRTQQIWETHETSIRQYVKNLKQGDDSCIEVVSSADFERSSMGLDVVFNVCVLDVEIPRVRNRIVTTAYRNLRNGGIFVLIVPRNDQTIKVRCVNRNRYLDGHFFAHRGVITFYRNFVKTTDLIRLVRRAGFALLHNLSVYRQVCLICRK
jgi:SAM-dependent methyltransferase